MSGELEAAGALTDAGLVAGAIEGRGPGAVGEGACLNCGAALAGRFCRQCGQVAHPHRSLLHLGEEFLHGLFHFDTKVWRTLPMLMFRPGTLTRNYVYGKRARYISPLAMFLFSVFLMFFAFTFVEVNPALSGDRADLTADLTEARAELAEAQREFNAAQEKDGGEYVVEQRLTRQAVALARAQVARAQAQLVRFDRTNAAFASDDEPVVGAAPAPAEQAPAPVRSEAIAPAQAGDESQVQSTWQEQVREASKSGDLTFRTGVASLDAGLRHAAENPDLALYKVQQAAYKFSFLLVPISLPFIMLLFIWKRGITLYDHVVFALYSLSFASIVFVATAFATRSPWTNWLGGVAVGVGLPVNMYFQLKGAYALNWWSAFWRGLLLCLFAVVALAIWLVAVFLLGVTG